MRVLLANKFFYDHGGPEKVAFATSAALRDHGHEVVDFAMAHERNHPSAYADYFAPSIGFNDVDRSGFPLKQALRFIHSRPAAKQLNRLLETHPVDIAHLHSISHQLTPSIIPVLRKHGVPVVMTLHDYKLVCPAYTLLANGAPCERCSGGRFAQAVVTQCRGAGRSSLLAVESYFHHVLRKSYDAVNVYISPSEFLANKFADMGFDGEISVVPNPINAVHSSPADRDDSYFLFIGRLVQEKGVSTLLRAVSTTGVELQVVGTGPLDNELKGIAAATAAPDRIRFLGDVRPPTLNGLIRNAIAVVVPSEWYENQAMVILEAFANGTPVIASAVGGNTELVTHMSTGLTYPMGDVSALGKQLAWALENRDVMAEMGATGASRVERYSSDHYYTKLLAVYERAISNSASLYKRQRGG